LTGQLEIVPMDEAVSIKAAELRAKYGIRTPDAIQLASVIHKKGRYSFPTIRDLNILRILRF